MDILPKNPQAMLEGQALLNEGYEYLKKLENARKKTTETPGKDPMERAEIMRTFSLAITNVEQGLLWLRQAVYLRAYEGATLDTEAERRHL